MKYKVGTFFILVVFAASAVWAWTPGGAWDEFRLAITDLVYSIIPHADNSVDLGSSTKEFKNLYVDGTAYLDTVSLEGGITLNGDLEMGDTPYSIDGGSSGLAFDPDNDTNNEITFDTAGEITAVGGFDAGDTNIVNVADIALVSISSDGSNISVLATNSTDILQIGDGTYSWDHAPMVGVEGILEVDGTIYSDGSIFINGSVRLDDEKQLVMGTGQDVKMFYTANGGGDDCFSFRSAVTSANDSAGIHIARDKSPSADTAHDNYLSPTFVIYNDEGADSNDYSAVVIGERAQSNVATVHYMDFYAMTGAFDNSTNPTTAERGACFRFGDNPTATGHGMTSGDVLFNDDVEIDGTLFLDGTISGTIINAQDTFLFFERILSSSTAPKLLLGWVSPATTEVDYSSAGNDATYNGTMTTADQLFKASGYVIDPDGTDDYLNVSDDAAFSFGNGGADTAFSYVAVVQVTDQAANQILCSKWDETTASEAREWRIYLNATENLVTELYDESADGNITSTTDGALSVGWHVIAVTYSGNAASTGFTVYVDGVSVAETGTDTGYTATEDLAHDVWLGAQESTAGVAELFMQGDFGLSLITAEELSAFSVWKMFVALKGLYNL